MQPLGPPEGPSMPGCRAFFAATSLVLGTALVASAPAAPAAPLIREPAVAGLFYPADPAALSRAIDTYLAAAKGQSPGTLRALICPHAGYVFSGPVAASGFRLLQGVACDTVLLLAPSHYAFLRAASVSDADFFRPPLGDVRISPRARQLAQSPPFALAPACRVQRPDWADRSSRPVPAPGSENADTWEHADEVEVPFLQKTLGTFQLVPVVMGEVDPAAAARALAPQLDDRTIVVVSSDLSHYHRYAEACALDRECVASICALDVEKMAGQEACGRIPILTLLHLAKQRGWQAELLDYRNSGDTAGDKSRVVGYAAVAFYQPVAEAFSAVERQQQLELARSTLRAVTQLGAPPPESPASPATSLSVPRGCFVTLTKHGALRGCIGNIEPRLPLWQAVAGNARSAALEDPRFRPVRAQEVDQIEIEISVLTKPEPLAFRSPDDLLRQLHPGEDGVVLRLAGGDTATYLPQVWEQLPDKVEFLDSLAEKAGRSAGDWRKPGVAVSIYHVVAFKEPAH